MSFVRSQVDSFLNESSFGDGTLRDILGNRSTWPPPQHENVPWSLKEEAATKKQILEQADLIKKLQRQLEEARAVSDTVLNTLQVENLAQTVAKGIQETSTAINSNTNSKEPMDTQQGPQVKRVSLPVDLVRELEGDYAGRCVIALMFGPRPPMEVLKKWVEDTWAPYNVQLESVQVLPKGYYP